MNKQVKSKPKKNSNEEKEIKIQITKAQYDELFNSRPQFAKLIKPVNQKDVYYDTEDLYITNLNRGLRVRFNEDAPHCVEFKSLFYNSYNSNNPWFIEEITYPFPLESEKIEELFLLLTRLKLLSAASSTCYSSQLAQFSEIEHILGSFQLKPMIIVDKHRLGYQVGKVQYIFDYIEGLGYFLEIESEEEDPLNILEKLEIDDYQIVRNGYNDMLAVKIPSYLPNEEKQRNFRDNPSWNILPEEEELVEEMLSRYK